MKIAVIGGGGVRTPLLVSGLAGSDLPLSEVVLYDVDASRLSLIAPLAQAMAGNVAVRPAASVAEAVAGAAFVFTSIRVGGIEARARAEAVALAENVVGQETVGPAGFAMAMATIPAMVAHAREVAAVAPNAWIVNFTNPVGIITQAVRIATGARIIGICDTPTELFEEVAEVLGVPFAECHFDYFGLNHLGWLREVYHRGTPRLAPLFDDRAALSRLYRRPLFDLDLLTKLRLLPTEYLYYYYEPAKAVAKLSEAGTSRGATIQALNARLFEDLARPGGDSVAVYRRYLATRDASYMQLEVGSGGRRAAPPAATLSGYDRIAVAVARAIHFNAGLVLPLDVENRGTLPELEEGDVVEVPCVVNANGALPLHVGRAPAAVRELLLRVKAYERLTIEAAAGGDAGAARKALATNPLVGNAALAGRLLAALGLSSSAA